jgi:hypothetical protein
MPEYEMIEYAGAGGDVVHGLLVYALRDAISTQCRFAEGVACRKPVGCSPMGRYPLAVLIHGGG